MGEEKPKMGRPRKKLDLKIIEELCVIQCTMQEIVAVFGVDYKTVARFIKDETGLTFSKFYKEKREAGKASLRRSQWLKATDPKKDNTVMQIWLGKQLLGQKDKIETEEKGPRVIRVELVD